MKKLLFLFLLSNCVTISFAQTTCSIKRAYAFFTVNMPGMIMKDDKGNDVAPTPAVERFIYVECSGTKAPVIEKVLYNSLPLITTVTRAESSVIAVSKRFEDGQDYKLTPAKGYTLWKVELQPVNDQAPVKQGCRNIIIKSKKIMLFIIFKQLTFLFKI